jgi:hypothetical protein
VDGGSVVKHVALFFMCACGPSGPQPEYPRAKCEYLLEASLDPATYVTEDPRASLFSDDRATWDSARCDPVRAALRPLDDAHDLEPDTLQRECDATSSNADPSIRIACRAGCFAERTHRAELLSWTRALKGVVAFDPKRVDFLKLEASCAAMSSPPQLQDGLARALWTCAGLPLPPKRFRLGFQERWENVYGQGAMSSKKIGFESMSVDLTEARRVRTITYEECGGAHSRWAVFGTGSP